MVIGSKTTYVQALSLYFGKFHMAGPQWNRPWNSTPVPSAGATGQAPVR